MSELYRLRSMTKLFGDFQELEKQSIYFESPGKLNDPMEGFRDIVWQGDRIVWTNLFRHYLYCLHMTNALIKVVGDSTKIEPQDIPVRGHVDQQPTPKAVNLFEDICDRVFEKTNLNEFIARIVNAKRKAHYDEMLFYLQSLHSTALHEIQDAYIDHGLAPDRERLEKPPSSSVFKAICNTPDLAQQIGDKRLLDAMFEISSRMMTGQLISHKYNARSESKSTLEDNRQLLIYDFPKKYLIQLERLLYPNWYVACFMRDYRNSSTWGHYGDNHKGACLIFEAETAGGASSLTLNKISGFSNNGELWQPSPMHFYEVKYGDKAGEIDFFRSIGWLLEAKLKEVWYSDKDGNLSECSTHLGKNIKSWRENYWNNLYPNITIKTRDWKYEHESRLILASMLTDLSDGRRRTLTYNFSSLKGIIFGISTPDNDKLRVIETIHKKCRENKRTDFEFFQAYYRHETGEIQKDKLHLKFSV